eukprot:gene6698-9187_t
MADPTFTSLLFNLTIFDNELRKSSEIQYDQIKESNPSSLLLSLLLAASDSSVPIHLRQLATVLLRRSIIVEKESLFQNLSSESQSTFKSSFMSCLISEKDSTIKLKLGELAGELAGYVLDDGEWPDLQNFALSSMQSIDANDRELAFVILGFISGSLLYSDTTPTINSNVIQSIVFLMQTSFVDYSNNGRIILASIRLLNSILLSLHSESQLDVFYPLLPCLFQGLSVLIESLPQSETNGEALVCVFLESMIEIAEEKGMFFSTTFDKYFDALIELMPLNHSKVSLQIKFLFMELMVTLCSSSPKRIRALKNPRTGEKRYFLSKILPVCIEYISHLEDDPSWLEADSIEEYDDRACVSDVGESSINRICIAMGVKSSYLIISQLIGPCLVSTQWQLQYTGIQCIANYLEVSATITDKNQLKLHRNEVVATLLLFIQNPHPRVKNATYYAISQLFIMHGKGLTVEQMEELMTVIIQGLAKSSNSSPRIRRTILISLMSLIDIAPTNYLEQHSGLLLSNIIMSLQDGPLIVQESCVSAIISIAQSVKGSSIWKGYYSVITPILQQLLQYSHSNNQESLWGQTLECYAIVGESCGKEVFFQDAMEMMRSLLSIQQQLPDNSEAEIYLMKAWVRIARCLGSEFLPFLQPIMEKLFHALSQVVTIPIDNPEDMEERSDIEMVETEKGWVAVRSAAVEEQSSACQLVILLVEKLQNHFYPYVEQTMRLLSSLIDSPHEDIRSFSIAAIPELIRSTGIATLNPSYSNNNDRGPLMELAGYSLGLLIKSVETESSLELIMTGLQAMKQTLLFACTDWSNVNIDNSNYYDDNYVGFLNQPQMEALTVCTKIVLKDSLQRRAVARAESQLDHNQYGNEADVNEDDEIIDIENEDIINSSELHYNIADLIGTILKTHKTDFYHIYMSQWHEICIKSSADVNSKRVAAYSVGIAAQNFPFIVINNYASFALSSLASCINDGESEESSRGPCTDNCVSAVGIILEKIEHNNNNNNNDNNNITSYTGLNLQYIWNQWVSYLPLRDDLDEGEKVVQQLIRLINEKRNNSLLFSNNDNWVKIIQAFIE